MAKNSWSKEMEPSILDSVKISNLALKNSVISFIPHHPNNGEWDESTAPMFRSNPLPSKKFIFDRSGNDPRDAQNIIDHWPKLKRNRAPSSKWLQISKFCMHSEHLLAKLRPLFIRLSTVKILPWLPSRQKKRFWEGLEISISIWKENCAGHRSDHPPKICKRT